MTTKSKSATDQASEPGWLTMAQACDYVGYSDRVLRDAINNADNPTPLQALKVSSAGHVRIKRAWLDEWLEARARHVETSEAAS